MQKPPSRKNETLVNCNSREKIDRLTFFSSTSRMRLIISMISCSSDPMSSSRRPAVIRENKHRYCFCLSIFVWAFASGTTAVDDDEEDDDDVIIDSSVVGECVRTRLQFRFNSVVIVSFEDNDNDAKARGDGVDRRKERQCYWGNWGKKRISQMNGNRQGKWKEVGIETSGQ